MAYILECERFADVLATLTDPQRAAFYKKRAPLGDAEFYLAVLTLPPDRRATLEQIVMDLRQKITPAGKAALARWRAADGVVWAATDRYDAATREPERVCRLRWEETSRGTRTWCATDEDLAKGE